MRVLHLDHVSFTVEDPQRSAQFYQRFGFEPFKEYFAAGPDVDEGTDTVDADMNIVWLRRPGEHTMLELIQYVNHGGGPAALNSKVGAAHLCFQVEDVDASYAELRAEGIRFLSAPHEDKFGVHWVYMRDPDGNTVEMLQLPDSPTAD